MPPVHYLINIIPFCQQYKNEIDNEETCSPDDRPSKTFRLSFHVHEGPGNIVCFINSEDKKYPVDKFKTNKICVNQEIGFHDPQNNFY